MSVLNARGPVSGKIVRVSRENWSTEFDVYFSELAYVPRRNIDLLPFRFFALLKMASVCLVAFPQSLRSFIFAKLR